MAHTFQKYGVELEYMIVDEKSLNIRPVADELLFAFLDPGKEEVERGSIAWSNELARHVIELKTNGPADHLDSLANRFQCEVQFINRWLEDRDLSLLPGGMHPWMDPHTETQLWPYGSRDIYNQFNKIFDCRGHGWANLQSTHLNLPFFSHEEFIHLHAAIRLVLPLVPALAASSPFVDGKNASNLDERLVVYQQNCQRIPLVTGRIIPEPVLSRRSYQQHILNRIYRRLTPLDPKGILQHEWVNARGAIARFDRGTIEIRVLDVQECPQADLSIIGFVVALVSLLMKDTKHLIASQKNCSTRNLHSLLFASIAQGGFAQIGMPSYLEAWDINGGREFTVGDLLQILLKRCGDKDAFWSRTIEFILDHGSLAQRLRKAASKSPDRVELHCIYSHLVECLARGELFKD